MSIRNRELSQFGSFIYIDDSTKTVGIATTATPYVGIGTTNAKYKLHIIGDTSIEGNINVSGMISSPGTSAVGIGTSFPINPLNGDLFYNIDYARIFVYYDELVLGIGTTSFWIDASPFNISAATAEWESVIGGFDVYRLNGSVGIGTSAFPQKLTVVGNVSAGQYISTVTSGTAPLVVLSDTEVTNLNASYLRGKTPPSGTIVGTTDSQTILNKVISSSSVSSAGIGFSGSTSGSTTVQASATASGTITLPATTDTLVAKNTSDILTNKTIAAGSNTISGLTNTNLSGTAGITNANLANSTISGISLGSNLNSLTFSSYLSSSGTYDGSTARTVSVAGTSLNTANTLIARDISGDFTAGTVNASVFNATTTDAFRVNGTTVISSGRSLINVVNGNFSGIVTASTFSGSGGSLTGIPNSATTATSSNTASAIVARDGSGNFTAGTVTATDFVSTSDETLKTNIQTIQDSLSTLQQLRGVTFDWKETNASSIGVIAQELEQVLPQLIKEGDIKTVNYNGLIGVLIEAVKELSLRVEKLENKID